MKNKKLILTIVFLILLKFCFFSMPWTFDFSIAPEFGFLNGVITENVWNADMELNGTRQVYFPTTKLSQLDWQMNTSPYFGAQFDVLINNHFLFNLGFYNAVKNDCGVMEDYDWKIYSQPDHLTNYSIHTNKLIYLYQINFDLGYLFFPKAQIPVSISPRIGLRYFAFDFTGNGGYRTYEDDNWKKIEFSDSVVIEYEQSYFAPRLSLYLNINTDQSIEFEFGSGVSYINQFDAFDIHKVRNEYFNDRIQSAWLLDYEIKLLKKINANNKIGIKWTLNAMLDSLGFTYYSNTTKNNFETTPMSGSLGGTDSFVWRYALCYIIKF